MDAQTQECAQGQEPVVKRSRRSYTALSTVAEDDAGTDVMLPAARRGNKRGRQMEQHAPMLLAPKETMGAPTPTVQLTAQPDEASLLPPLPRHGNPGPEPTSSTSVTSSVCQLTSDSNDAGDTDSPAADIDAVQNPASRRKRANTRRTVEQPSAAPTAHAATAQQFQRQRKKRRRSVSPPAVQTLRRSVRIRVICRVFDPTDPAAIAGYVQPRGISPDSQSGLPYDTGCNMRRDDP